MSTLHFTTGSNAVGFQTIFRQGTGGIIHSQPAPVALADADATVTAANVLAGIWRMTPTVDRVLTLPTAALLVASLQTPETEDSMEFSIINESAGAFDVDIAVGAGGTLVGNPKVLHDAANASSGRFLIRITDATATAETYDVIRIA